jgi:hypothetical protein
MIDLPADQFVRILPVLRASPMHSHRALAYAVLEGRVPGRVFVDQAANPCAAVVCNLNGFYFALGTPDEDLLLDLSTRLRQEPLSKEATVLFGDSPAWQPALRRAFEPLGAQPTARLGFDWRPSAALLAEDPARRLPAGYTFGPITVEIAQGILDGTATEEYGLDPWFIRTAGGPQAYVKPGLGLAVLRGSVVTSICGYCGLGGGEAELEVGTIPSCRGLGLATAVSLAFLHQCQEKGWLPAYTCGSKNLPSIGVAKKLGFVEAEEIHGYVIG